MVPNVMQTTGSSSLEESRSMRNKQNVGAKSKRAKNNGIVGINRSSPSAARLSPFTSTCYWAFCTTPQSKKLHIKSKKSPYGQFIFEKIPLSTKVAPFWQPSFGSAVVVVPLDENFWTSQVLTCNRYEHGHDDDLHPRLQPICVGRHQMASHAHTLNVHDVYPNLVNQCLSWSTRLDRTLTLSEDIALMATSWYLIEYFVDIDVLKGIIFWLNLIAWYLDRFILLLANKQYPRCLQIPLHLPPLGTSMVSIPLRN